MDARRLIDGQLQRAGLAPPGLDADRHGQIAAGGRRQLGNLHLDPRGRGRDQRARAIAEQHAVALAARREVAAHERHDLPDLHPLRAQRLQARRAQHPRGEEAASCQDGHRNAAERRSARSARPAAQVAGRPARRPGGEASGAARPRSDRGGCRPACRRRWRLGRAAAARRDGRLRGDASAPFRNGRAGTALWPRRAECRGYARRRRGQRGCLRRMRAGADPAGAGGAAAGAVAVRRRAKAPRSAMKNSSGPADAGGMAVGASRKNASTFTGASSRRLHEVVDVVDFVRGSSALRRVCDEEGLLRGLARAGCGEQAGAGGASERRAAPAQPLSGGLATRARAGTGSSRSALRPAARARGCRRCAAQLGPGRGRR